MRQPIPLRRLLVAGLLSAALVVLLQWLISRQAPPRESAGAPGESTAARGSLPAGASTPAPAPASTPAPANAGAAALGGRITLDGQAAVGAEVRSLAQNGETATERQAAWLAARQGPALARTAADGAWRLTELSPGEIRLLVTHPEAAEARVLTHHLRAGEDARLDCDLPRGLSLEGRVVAADGSPVTGAVVRAEPARQRAQGPLARSMALLCALDRGVLRETAVARTGPGGAFLLPQLGGEPQDLEALASDGRRGRLEGIVPGTRDIVIRLAAGGKISGRVRKGPPEAPVSAVRLDAGTASWDSQEAAVLRHALEPAGDPEKGPFATRTESDGSFVLLGLPGGTYRACVVAAGWRPFVSPPVDVPEAGEVRLAPIDLIADRPITGTVLTRSGQPIVGVGILAIPSGLPGQIEPAGTAVTDARGRYALEGLLAGLHDIETRSPEWAPARREEVKPGSRGIDFFLERGIELRGLTVDARSGEPLPAVEVSAFPAQRTTSDANGAFRLVGLPARVDARSSPVLDRLVVTAARQGYQTARVPVPWPPRAAAAAFAIELEPARAIAGLVRSADGSPAAGAQVRLVFPGVPDRLVHEGPAVTTAAGDDGSYRLILPPDLEIFSAGPRVLVVAHDARTRARGAAVILEESIEEAPDGAIAVDISLGTGAAVAGTVKAPDGQPVRGARVRVLHPPAPGNAGAMAHAFGITEELETARTDAAGAFTIPAVPPGDYLIEALAAGAAPLRRAVTVPEEGTLAVELELTAGRTLAGTVREPGGAPVAGARVLAQEDFTVPVTTPALQALAGEGAGERQTLTDASGQYQLAGLPDAPLFVAARSEDHETAHASAPTGIDRLDIVLRPVADIIGRIIDDATGEPVSGCWADLALLGKGPEDPTAVAWGATAGSRVWVAAADGSFAFLRVPAGGPYELRIETPEHRPFAMSLEVAPGMEPLLVRLQSGLTLHGAAIDQATGEPLVGVRIRGSTGRELRRSTSGEGGAFELRGLAPGTWTLALEREGYVRASQPVDVKTDMVVGELPLVRAGGLILVIEQLPPGETQVTATGGEPRHAHRARQVSEREFELDDLPPGTYTLTVLAEGYLPLTIGAVAITAGYSTHHSVTYSGQRRANHEREP